MKMIEVCGKEIKDECSHCGNILECELFRQGHGIKQERENIAKMIACQMKRKPLSIEFECKLSDELFWTLLSQNRIKQNNFRKMHGIPKRRKINGTRKRRL